nr:CNT_HP1_G0015800.mRNA.1.CDS.1 [Saccharomyces cerevisiae]
MSDFRLLPMLAFMYFLSSLDRSNIGNGPHVWNDRRTYISLVDSNQLCFCFLFDLPWHLSHHVLLVFSWSNDLVARLCSVQHKSVLALRVLLGTFGNAAFPTNATNH